MDAALKAVIAEIEAVGEQVEEDRQKALRGEVIVSARVADLPMVVDEYLPGWQETGAPVPEEVSVTRGNGFVIVRAWTQTRLGRGREGVVLQERDEAVSWGSLGAEMARAGTPAAAFEASRVGRWGCS